MSIDRLDIRFKEEEPEREAMFQLFGVASAGESSLVDDPPSRYPGPVHTWSPTSGGCRWNPLVETVHTCTWRYSLDFQWWRCGETCLVNVPRYVVWQQMYVYESAWEDLPTLNVGMLRVRCTCDNSESNVMLEKYLGGPVT